jgi:DNA-binding NtrC family response regulator
MTPALSSSHVDPRLALDVLVLDADALERDRLVALLGDLGHRVALGDPDCTSTMFVAGRVDLIVSAVRPPVVDGLALLHHLRRVAPSADVVLVAGAPTVAEAVAVTRAGAVYLGAPVSEAELAAAIAELVERRRTAATASAIADAAAAAELLPLSDAIGRFEHAYLLRALEQTSGNRSRAARMLGISRKSLWAKLKRHQAGAPTLTVVES